jgi:NADH dehydrogenase
MSMWGDAMPGRRVVIVGGGFGGVRCARTLRRRLARDCEVVLFNHENHMVFHPLLPEVAGASINADAVAAPLRQMLRGVHCRTETVRDINLRARTVEYESHDGQTLRLDYDHVVVACGRSVNRGMVPGMSDHSFALKTVGDAMSLRSHVIQQLENAEVCSDPARRRWYLSIVVVGGGFSGVEVAGELNDLIRTSRRFYPNVREEEVSVTLLHSGDHLLPEISADLRTFAQQKMQQAGITVLLRARVAAATAEGVWLSDERQVAGATVVCTIGTRTPLLVERLESPKEKGSLLTEPDMRLRGEAHAWAIGDCARVVNALDNGVCPPTGQFAERQGRQVAENIVRTMRGESTRAFAFKPLGQLCAIGGRNAVAEIAGVKLSGFPAWFMWRSVYLFKLPSWSRRVKVGADWAWDLLFARDLVNLKTDPTERVSRAYFRPGDHVFRQGDPALNFYLVEKGVLEVVRTQAGTAEEELVAILGPGEFFGEMALLENRSRSASVRARTEVEVTTLGAQVFSRFSKSLAPLQQKLAEAMRQRGSNVWTRLPEVHAFLSRQPLQGLMERAPQTIGSDQSIEQALWHFSVHHADAVYVVDPNGRMIGILTRTDLFRAIDVLSTIAPEERRSARVGSFMLPEPIVVAHDDSAMTAAGVMWSRGLKSLPVVNSAGSRHVVGCIRAETLMQCVLERLVPLVEDVSVLSERPYHAPPLHSSTTRSGR